MLKKIFFISILFFIINLPNLPSKAEDSIDYDKLIKLNKNNNIFNLYLFNNRYFIDISDNLLNKDMLWYTEISKSPSGILYNGAPVISRVIRWEKQNDKINLVTLSFSKRLGISPKQEENILLKSAINDSSFPSIIKSFPIINGKEKNINLIEVTDFFKSDIPEFSIIPLIYKEGFSLNYLDTERSYISNIKSFPINLEIQSVLTYPFPKDQYLSSKFNSVTFQVHHSIIILPENIMKPRLYDNRVGFFTKSFEDYTGKIGELDRNIIIRYRLEKKYPNKEISEPLKPIIYYISNEVPQKWRPYIKKGVESWNKAFEEAGFKNAIICKNAPSIEEDPDWNPSDVRYSVIRWAAESIENAMGPNINDPRSGEIISSNIIIWNDMIKQLQYWYYVQCSALDKRAMKLPLPDDLTGELLQYIVSHETGHSLGLTHNFKGSSAYSIKNLRNTEFTNKFGNVASIMSYGRFNYIAQPEDKIKQLIPVISPYDFFAIKWGYKEFEVKNEKKALKEIISTQKNNSYLNFGGEDLPSEVDPTINTENIGSNSIEATELGLKNLKYSLKNIPNAVSLFDDNNIDYTKDLYNEILETKKNWFEAVIKKIGGVIENKNFDLNNPRFIYIEKEDQKKAMKFIIENAFIPFDELSEKNIINNTRSIDIMSLFFKNQSYLLDKLLSPLRIKLISDSNIFESKKSYKLNEFFDDLQDGIWSELKNKKITIDLYKRELQNNYIKRLKYILLYKKKYDRDPNESFRGFYDISIENTNAKAIIRRKLFELSKNIQLYKKKSINSDTFYHLENAYFEIEKILKII